MAIVIVPPNNPTIAWAATLDPGHHSFSKWAILLPQDFCRKTMQAVTDQPIKFNQFLRILQSLSWRPLADQKACGLWIRDCVWPGLVYIIVMMMMMMISQREQSLDFSRPNNQDQTTPITRVIVTQMLRRNLLSPSCVFTLITNSFTPNEKF